MFNLMRFLCALGFVLGLNGQTDLVYPWVTNNASFRSKLVIVNPGSSEAAVVLVATRADGTRQTLNKTVPAFGQLVESSGALFTELGEGGGYMVRLTSSVSGLQGGLVVSSADSASGDSPAQANVVAASSAATVLLFTYLPNDPAGFAAPVISNLGSVQATVTYRAYQNGEIVATTTRAIPSGRPYAEGVNTLFPEVSGDLYLVADSAQPLIGAAFIFNSLKEPSMANALSLSAVPDPDAETEVVSFINQIQPIFNQRCGSSSCHLNGGTQSGLNLDPENSYGNLVDVESVQISGMDRVEPGNPDRSFLYLKLLPSPPSGSRMPRTGSALNESEIGLIRSWILAGAQNN